MSETWRQEYMKLTDFIKNHPEIKIEPSVVKIMGTVRPEFYQYFNATRKVFIKETNGVLLEKAEILSKNYIQVEKELSDLPGIDRISTFIPIGRFLHDPIDELERKLYDPLFDLLKGRVDIETFEKEAASRVSVYCDALYKYGYEMWLVLSLIKLLQPDKSFRVIDEEFEEPDVFKHTGGLGTIEREIPAPVEVGILSFERAPEVGYILADQIIHSVRLGHYFSFRPEVLEAMGEATSRSANREWLPISAVVDLDPNVILVYVGKKLEELSLIADIEEFCRPDLIIECVGLSKSYNEDRIVKIIDYHKSYKPRLGTYIISNEPVAEQLPEDMEAGIHYLPIGFDQPKLEKIIELFIDKENTGK